MKRITSKDGTALACWQTGHGEPLLLIHGTSGDALTWSPLLPFLEPHFSVWTLDRRGRGHSGDHPDYCLQNEAEDIAAVIHAIGGKVHIFGHSFGALCALEAALLTDNMATLMLYEPPLSLAGSGWSAAVDAQMHTLLSTGHNEAALLLFFRDVLGMAQDELLTLQASSSWSIRVTEARTVHRELQAVAGYAFTDNARQSFHTPTLLLLGSDSPPRRYRIADTLKNTLPNSQLVLLDGQQHSAVRTAPELLANKLIEFKSKRSQKS